MTHLKPEHFGEPLVAALLQRIVNEAKLQEVPCYSAVDRLETTLATALTRLNFGNALQVGCNAGLSPICIDGNSYPFDGFSQIDCLLTDSEKAVAIEVKLGTTRMAGAEFRNRFLTPCKWSKHIPPRITGNMIAILDGRFENSELSKFALSTAVASGLPLPVLQSWILLLRTEVWNKWASNPPRFNRPCSVLLFEDLVPAVGGAKEFDAIITKLVGGDFANSWGLVS